MKRSLTQNPRRAGFTLVEMLVVLGILVLLASMVVPRILGRQKAANIDFAKSQIGSLRGAWNITPSTARTIPSRSRASTPSRKDRPTFSRPPGGEVPI